jgi:hypothetical protein
MQLFKEYANKKQLIELDSVAHRRQAEDASLGYPKGTQRVY